MTHGVPRLQPHTPLVFSPPLLLPPLYELTAYNLLLLNQQQAQTPLYLEQKVKSPRNELFIE